MTNGLETIYTYDTSAGAWRGDISLDQPIIEAFEVNGAASVATGDTFVLMGGRNHFRTELASDKIVRYNKDTNRFDVVGTLERQEVGLGAALVDGAAAQCA